MVHIGSLMDHVESCMDGPQRIPIQVSTLFQSLRSLAMQVGGSGGRSFTRKPQAPPTTGPPKNGGAPRKKGRDLVPTGDTGIWGDSFIFKDDHTGDDPRSGPDPGALSPHPTLCVLTHFRLSLPRSVSCHRTYFMAFIGS